MKKTSPNYKRQLKPIWCPGCGDYGVFHALEKTFKKLELLPENIVVASGIGCSGRMSHFFNTYSLHGTHGRVVPTALGVKAVRPDLTVIAVGGDGDGLGIGGGHIPHAARKNADITYLLLDNRIYGLTKGQASPTSPEGLVTKTTPVGVSDLPVNPIPMFLSYNVSFVARTASNNLQEMTDVMEQGIRHRGMSLIYVLSPCVTFPVLKYQDLKDLLQPLPEDHPQDDKMKAMEMAYSGAPLYTGIFYRENRPTMDDHVNEHITQSGGKRDAPTDDWEKIKELMMTYS